MKTDKPIKKIVRAQPVLLGKEKIDQALPVYDIEQIDPFLLIHHAKIRVLKGIRQQDAGVGPHPHRGFSPVTFVYEGSVLHRDSLGNEAEVFAGGTQWMHAGSGIIHSERPGKELASNGGEHEIVQFWVNTPAGQKMDKPYYKPISYEETPKIKKDEVIISVVAGEFEGIKGIVPTFTSQKLLRIESKTGADFNLDIPETFNCLIYLLDGELVVNGKTVVGKELVWFENEGTAININANQDTRAILLSGEPIGESVASYGQFVMNSRTEIQQAIRDHEEGKMGELIETNHSGNTT